MLIGIYCFRTPVAVVIALVCRRIVDLATARWLMAPLPWKLLRLHFSPAALELAFSSIRQSFAQISLGTLLNAGPLIANGLYGLASAGIYKATFDITAKVWFLSNGMGVVAFPYFARVLSGGGGPPVFSRLVQYLNASWGGYLLIAVLLGIASPYLLPLAGLPGATNRYLFLLVLLGVCVNAHATVSLELLQASGRSLHVGGMCLVSLGILAAVAVGCQTRFGLLSLAWGWLSSLAFLAVVSDASALARMSETPSALWRMHVFKAAALGGVLLALSLLTGAGPAAVLAAGLGVCIPVGVWVGDRRDFTAATAVCVRAGRTLRGFPAGSRVDSL